MSGRIEVHPHDRDAGKADERKRILDKLEVNMTKVGNGRYKGRKEFTTFKEGKKLTASQAIKAYCYTCMAEYADGAGDCGDKNCPLHEFMPYNKARNPRRVHSKETIEKIKKGAVK